jgi:aspartyl-tRNA(Asn)/glutamyl-tRNA(Gln) amidotransferase subunit B
MAANWIIGELTAALNREQLPLERCPLAPERLAGLLRRIGDGTLSGRMAKEVFEELWTGSGSADDIIAARGLRQVSDAGQIAALVDAVVAANPAQVEQFRAGKEKVLAFLVGQVMKQSQGRANPQQVSALMQERLRRED